MNDSLKNLLGILILILFGTDQASFRSRDIVRAGWGSSFQIALGILTNVHLLILAVCGIQLIYLIINHSDNYIDFAKMQPAWTLFATYIGGRAIFNLINAINFKASLILNKTTVDNQRTQGTIWFPLIRFTVGTMIVLLAFLFTPDEVADKIWIMPK